MDSFDYGNIPQHRKRIFIVAFLDYEHCERFDFPKKIKPEVKLNDILVDIYVDNIGAVWSNNDFENRERHMSLHIRNICRDICNAAELYYQKHKDELGFIRYKISQIDPDAEHPWEYSKEVSW